MVPFKYRFANEADLPALQSLAQKAWEPYCKQLDTRFREAYLDSLTDGNTYTDLLKKSLCVVCEADKTIVGAAYFLHSGHADDFYEKDWARIRFISVDPACQGHGIGTELTRKCIEIAKNCGEKIIALHTSEMMKTALYIYEKLGFVMVKELPEKFGKKYRLLKMEL